MVLVYLARHILLRFINQPQCLPEINELEDIGSPTFVVIDNLMIHYYVLLLLDTDISMFYLTQHIFHQERGQREISLNAH